MPGGLVLLNLTGHVVVAGADPHFGYRMWPRHPRKIERSLQDVFTNRSISPQPVQIGVEEDKVGGRVFLSWELSYRDRTGSLSNPDGKQKPRAVLLQILICCKNGLGSVEICTDQRDQLIKVAHYGEHQGAIAAIRSCRTAIIRGGPRSLD
ncbi:hypothetical protein MRB53_009350 [Persea americana]|uniref:Uncharacterized protein n=1 Tax=Persea americana TaxID=3435 RepID=A0ACC2LPJ7_PERAE|nr:hypothetical protein MRB53_009350 [Persea americana]